MRTYIYSIITIILIGMISCVDRTFDEPNFLFEDPDLEVTQSIAALKSMHVDGQYEILSGGNVISGVVIANDKSGNFYETIVISDGTGGIEVKLGKRSLFNTFPVGRNVFIKTDGLVMGDYNELIQLGFSSSDGGFVEIPGEEMDEYVLGGALNIPFDVDSLSLTQLNENYVSMLVTLKGVQFADQELGNTFADAQYKVTTNRMLVDCAGNEILLRTSGYASFAGETVPEGKGDITAVMSRYRDDWQLYLREIEDIDMNGERCGSGTGNETLVSILDLRNQYNSGDAIIEDEKKIEGTVISDRIYDNIYENNLVIQDGSGGIVLRFSDAHDFAVNDKVEIVVSNMELSDYNGLLQISNLALSGVVKTGNEAITPREATVDQIMSNAEAWESTLVIIKSGEISGGSVYSDYDIVLSDNTGTIDMYTRSVATFANDPVPSGTVDVTGIVGDFNGAQINIRSKDDVSGGTVEPQADIIFSDDFEEGISKWTIYSVLGDEKWEWSSQYGNPGACARVSGYDDGAHANEDWLVSPMMDLTEKTEAYLLFESAMNYSGNVLELYISKDYDGSSDPNAATWVQKTAPLSSGSWDWVSSGNLDLKEYAGSSIYFAFKFTCTDQESSTWEIDNVEFSVK